MNTETLLGELNTLSAECRRAQAMEIIANQKLAAAIRKGERLCRLLESLHIKDDFQTMDADEMKKDFLAALQWIDDGDDQEGKDLISSPLMAKYFNKPTP